jgi:hypothetical protein
MRLQVPRHGRRGPARSAVHWQAVDVRGVRGGKTVKTTVLTKQDRESLLGVLSGARQNALQSLIHATGEARDFYHGWLKEYERLEAILKSKAALALEDMDDEAEYRAEMGEE